MSKRTKLFLNTDNEFGLDAYPSELVKDKTKKQVLGWVVNFQRWAMQLKAYANTMHSKKKGAR